MIKARTDLVLLPLVLLLTSACSGPPVETPPHPVEATFELVTAADVDWQPLNPARGDKSPKAGTLWGDRGGSGSTGFLVQFVDGFSSPPHIHNVSYRGVVLEGLVHNDDPAAAEMWMPAGSFWTQPRGEVHITAAKGRTNVAFIEIEDGPYLVLPTEEAFDSGERPLNVDPTNLVWIDPPAETGSSASPQRSFLWGSPRESSLNGSFLRLPPVFSGEIRSRGGLLRAVVIQGRANYREPGEATAQALDPGSYFGSQGEAVHRVSVDGTEPCVLYIRAAGQFDVIGGQAEPAAP